MPQQPSIVENDRGDRMAWNGRAWVSIGNKNAPGSAYLTTPVGEPDKSEAAYFRTMRDKDNGLVADARSGLADARRMEGLLSRQKTGGVYSVPVLGSIVGAFDPEIREMDAIQSKQARKNKVPGEGAISDFDAREFLKMTYGKDKPTATNRALIQAQRIANDRAIQRRQFMEWHYNTMGTTSGAEEAWDRYAQDNPIFDPSTEAQGSPILNGRAQAWRSYFGVERTEGDKRPTVATQDLQRAQKSQISPATQKAYREAYAAGRIKREGPTGSAKNPFVSTSWDQLNRLPKGSYAFAPDGSFGQVR